MTVDKNGEPVAHYECRDADCSSVCFYTIRALRMHPKGGIVCQHCWTEEHINRDHHIEVPDFDNLPKFTPCESPKTLEIGRLKAKLQRQEELVEKLYKINLKVGSESNKYEQLCEDYGLTEREFKD